MKEAIRSLAIVIFGWYTLYLAYIWLDELMAKEPEMFLSKSGYIQLFLSAIITLLLFWSIVRNRKRDRCNYKNTNTLQSEIEEEV